MIAFEKYLISLPKEQAIDHFMNCMCEGDANNIAWQLFERLHGVDWSANVEEIPDLVGQVIDKLREDEVA